MLSGGRSASKGRKKPSGRSFFGLFCCRLFEAPAAVSVVVVPVAVMADSRPERLAAAASPPALWAWRTACGFQPLGLPGAPLPALEDRRALLQEGLHRLLVVFGFAGLSLGHVGQVEAFLETHVHAAVHQVLDEGQRLGGTLG